MRGFFDHARASKSDHALGLGDNDIAQRGEAGHDAGSGRICEHGNVGKPLVGMAGEGAAGFCHLHETQHSFVHAGAAGSGHDNDSRTFVGAVLDGARDSFTDDRAHGCGEKTEVHYCNRNLVAVEHTVAANHGVG